MSDDTSVAVCSRRIGSEETDALPLQEAMEVTNRDSFDHSIDKSIKHVLEQRC